MSLQISFCIQLGRVRVIEQLGKSLPRPDIPPFLYVELHSDKLWHGFFLVKGSPILLKNELLHIELPMAVQPVLSQRFLHTWHPEQLCLTHAPFDERGGCFDLAESVILPQVKVSHFIRNIK